MERALGQWPEAVITVHGPFRECDLSCSDPDGWQKNLQMALNAMDVAKRFGARAVTFHVRGSGSAREWNDENHKAFLRSFARLADKGRDIGIPIMLENMLPGRFTAREEELGALVEEFSSNDVGVCIDTGHAQLNGNLAGFVEQFASRAGVLHLQDNSGGNGDEHLIPGKGSILWSDFVTGIKAGGFRGEKVVEVRSIGTLSETLAAIQQSIVETDLHRMNNGL